MAARKTRPTSASHRCAPQIATMVQAGSYRAEIARQLGLAEGVVGNVMKALGLKVANGNLTRAREYLPRNLTTELAHRLYVYRLQDGAILHRVTRGCAKAGAIAGSIKRDGYRQIPVVGKHYQAHHIVWLMHHGELPVLLDHINGLRTDNRIENLRAATAGQNCANNHSVWGSTPFKGVSLQKQTNKYQASIRAKYIGVFDDVRDAARAYDFAAEALFGEFARTNASLGLL